MDDLYKSMEDFFASYVGEADSDIDRRRGPGRRASDRNKSVKVGNTFVTPLLAPGHSAANEPFFTSIYVPNNAPLLIECPYILDFCAKLRAKLSPRYFSSNSLFCASISRYIPADPASPLSAKLVACL